MRWRTPPGGHDGYELLMVGWAGAAWHLELVQTEPGPDAPSPGMEDLLVLYLDELPAAELIRRLTDAGGRVVAAANPYWDRWGVTITDPDGYRLVLSQRSWPPV